MARPATDPALWTVQPRFGPAGGPDEVILTEEGEQRAFAVGAQIRRGPGADALEALWSARGEGYLLVRSEGARVRRTDLGRFDQVAWGYLIARELVESFQDECGDGVRLTDAGQRAASAGIEERHHLIDRCRRAKDAERQEPVK
jgi:hypothetical protein